MKTDLHVHSNYSDGSDSVEEVIKKAHQQGVTQLSFVDHDTVAGWPEVQRMGEKYKIKTIPGIELSAYDFKRNRKVHILGYCYHPLAPNIQAVAEPVRKRRQAHSLWQIEQLNKHGYRLDADKIMEMAKPSNIIYKQHIMRQLTEAAYSSREYRQLYQSLFKRSGIASGDIRYMDVFDAVQAIVADGGIAVVAHPGQLDSYELIPELIDAGLGGIERNHPDHGHQDHQKVEALANDYQLMMTGGTDYHGIFSEVIEVGEVLSSESFKSNEIRET
ncbi:PHP domain-containing protein [Virgibacillus sp. NKC19-16]|uniref:PHP domain-containing protein n=1 Tax=Virgibacillus salidurans TaxID=2831673 RepID=UPI001F26B9DE|nr:PHP domain-containing protein [Virgibacillus sp. NKC19-16]UJL45923.1 PHP domain-containing protein [Virgibacillus sp. NKC19-16]